MRQQKGCDLIAEGREAPLPGSTDPVQIQRGVARADPPYGGLLVAQVVRRDRVELPHRPVVVVSHWHMAPPTRVLSGFRRTGIQGHGNAVVPITGSAGDDLLIAISQESTLSVISKSGGEPVCPEALVRCQTENLAYLTVERAAASLGRWVDVRNEDPENALARIDDDHLPGVHLLDRRSLDALRARIHAEFCVEWHLGRQRASQREVIIRFDIRGTRFGIGPSVSRRRPHPDYTRHAPFDQTRTEDQCEPR